jgi:hypothetical protein
MKWIHATYRIFKSGVKPKARKCGFEAIKKANPYAEVHLSGFGYHPDIQNEFSENFGQIMVGSVVSVII